MGREAYTTVKARQAFIAQLAERGFCKSQVGGSRPSVGSKTRTRLDAKESSGLRPNVRKTRHRTELKQAGLYTTMPWG